MSRNVLKEHDAHTYFDDLESFYYIFCWLVSAFEAAGVPKAELPEEPTLWDLPYSHAMKGGHMGFDFDLPISPWFGKSLSTLAVDLHAFFKLRRRRALDPVDDYGDFLSTIRQCISGLEIEESETTEDPQSTSLRASDTNLVDIRPPKHKSESITEKSGGESSAVPPRRRLVRRKLLPPQLARPRRSTANYGCPGNGRRLRSHSLTIAKLCSWCFVHASPHLVLTYYVVGVV